MNTRREFLKRSIGAPLLLSLAPSVPWVLLRSTAHGAGNAAEDGRVLVVLQLSGGNDGLNTVVPFEDEAYGRSRPTLRLPKSELHKLNGQLGLHPRMGSLYRLFQEGQLAVLQGVGCPGHSGDHERAMLAWQTAVAEPEGGETGWLGRATDFLRSPVCAAGVYVGNIPRPLGITASRAVVPSIRPLKEALVFGRGLRADEASSEDGPIPAVNGGSMLQHVRLCLAEGQRSRVRLETASKTSAAVEYPAYGLAQDLRTVANLIRAEVGIRIFYVELGGGGIGGFDNHANQLGNHCALLEQLAKSVAAFAADLSRDRLLERVWLLTFSEFGRTVAENGRRGTDHGNAASMFLVGGKLRAGIHGAHPSLTDLNGGALKHHTDFRSVYATALEDWLGIPATPILNGEFNKLSLV
jgi:uncharacterized protein (DUF1501 family)